MENNNNNTPEKELTGAAFATSHENKNENRPHHNNGGKNHAAHEKKHDNTKADNEIAEKLPQGDVEIVGVRFKPVGKIYYFDPNGLKLEGEQGVILETARGIEYGTVAIPNRMVSGNEIVSPLKKIIRAATPEDIKKLEKNREVEARARQVWAAQVAIHKLEMTLVDVEYTFDNTKLLFYFTAEGRIDFRNFVKDVAAVFKTRIELRQIGVRDEAKQIGGYGVCGREFCCRTFLDEFQQVSIKMAKEQGLSLNSVKISGTCGRLMCCLRYESQVYEEEIKKTPPVDSIVETPDGKGVVVESNILAGLIKVRLDASRDTAPRLFSREQVKVVGKIKRNDNAEIDEELKKLQD
ncbi:MAG: stage 0 sporulation protein [Ruminococcaceae bacterium]|nr:stage 0 sporulation protein [Oscillospiraceae bacterium]